MVEGEMSVEMEVRQQHQVCETALRQCLEKREEQDTHLLIDLGQQLRSRSLAKETDSIVTYEERRLGEILTRGVLHFRSEEETTEDQSYATIPTPQIALRVVYGQI